MTCRNGHDKKFKREDGRCGECRRLQKVRSRLMNKDSDLRIKKQAIKNAKSRAEKQGLEFSLTVENIPDIPKFCPILDIPLIVGNAGFNPNSPSLDKIVPDLGYIPGNVQWISNKANIIKSNATASELIKVGLHTAKKVEDVWDAKGWNVPKKSIDWFMDYWYWYDNLKTS